MQALFSELLKNMGSLLSSFTVFDFLDICLVAFILYNVIKFIRQTKSIQIVKGIVFLGIIFIVVKALNMQVSTYVLSRLFSDVVLVLVLLFQPEIRHVLESVGRKRLSYNRSGRDGEDVNETVVSVCKACSDMSDGKIGALIVFERQTLLGDITDTGSFIDAAVSPQIIENIFFPKAPLHDGAAIIRGDRVAAAGCILPLTQDSLSSELGTRHRAAVGISEQSDALVVVVSEETGGISVADHGKLRRNVSPGELREILLKRLTRDDPGEQSFFKKLFGGKKNG